MSRLAAPPTAANPPATAFTTLEVVKGEKTRVIPPSYADDATVNLSENGLKVLHRRYLRRDIDGSLLESVAGMFYRVAYHVAGAEAAHNGDIEATTRTFYDLLTELRFFPNSPTFTGAGTPLGQLAACFVLPIADDMGRDADGIFSTLRVAALIQQTGGGNGFSFSRLRPKGDIVHTSSGQATGPVGFLRVYDQAFGEIAQGGCLLPETLVFTDAGLMRLDELVDVNQAGWQSHRRSVPTDDGQRSSPRGFNNGMAPVLRVETAQGLTITGTHDHKVKVMTSAGPVWRQLDRLQPGDSILVMLGQHQGKLRALRRPQKTHGNQVDIEFPSILDEPLAFILGYLTGDGFVAEAKSDNRIGFSVAHSSYLIEELPRLLQVVFPGCTVHTQQKSGDASVTFVIDSALVKRFLQLNGFVKGKSHEVSVPRLVRRSPAPIVGAYLRGLFEADGSLAHHCPENLPRRRGGRGGNAESCRDTRENVASHFSSPRGATRCMENYPQLNTTSERLAQEVATLLIGLGCPVAVRSNQYTERWGHRPQWIVRIQSHEGLAAWRQRIGCDQRSRFVVCHAFQPNLERESSYLLPNPDWWTGPVLDAITLPQIDRRQRGEGINLHATDPALRKRLLRYSRGDRQLTLSGYRALVADYPEFAEPARPVDNLWFVTVSKTEDAGEALTLDLEVDDNHTYLANGMVTHNTRRGANMAVLRVDHPDIADFITCKAEEGTITNFNISVAITDEFMQAVKEDKNFDLRSPRDNKVWKTVRARALFDKIIHYAHNNGEPGALFIDAANRSNPVPHLYDLEATNPCVTGETLIYTADGLQRADVLARSGRTQEVVVDGRFGVETIQPASEVFPTGTQDVYRLETKEGYCLRLTGNHKVMTSQGWVEARHLQPGDRVHILNRPGAFGVAGTRELGLVLGWLVGDGTINQIRAVLSFFGEEKTELAPLFADAVTAVVDTDRRYSAGHDRRYPVGITEILARDEVRIQSDRLRLLAAEHGLNLDKLQVPPVVFHGSRETQQAFLQALFSADGTVNDGGGKGCSVRLTSVSERLLQDVQRLLLNFGVFSRIYRERRPAGLRRLPDGKGGTRPYFCQAYHELAISKNNLIPFAEQIGFLGQAKQSALLAYLDRMQRGSYQESFTARVTRLVHDGKETVYDLTQPTAHSFIANGFVVHNCGEQWLGPYENCCLGSINLGVHVMESADGHSVVDWAALERTVRESTHFLDNVVDANTYVPAVPQVAEAAFRARRIGLGIMGLGDLMYKLGIRYGSEDGQEFAGQVMEFVRYHSMARSIELAEERGPFLAYRGSIYDPEKEGGMTWQPPRPIAPFARDWGRPPIEWSTIVEGIRRHGIRNAAQTTVAPTGTIATVSGCEGYGCEPVFALGYIRHFKDGDKDVELAYTSPLFEQALEKANLSEARKQQIKEHAAIYGSCQDLEDLPADLRHTFVVSNDISAEEHVRMQAALQAFVDNSLSKTINFPEGASEEDVAQAYMLAWELGCKGLTVYVTGSRQEVVLETMATQEKKSEREAGAVNSTNGYVNGANGRRPQEVAPVFTKRPRPRLLQGSTYRKDTPLGAAYITVNSDEEGEPFEVFLNIGKAGSDVSAVSEALGRLISLTLRMPGPLPPSERLRWVMDEMAGIGGGRALGFGANRVRSLPDGVAQVIAEHLSGLPAHPEAVSDEQMALPLADRPIGDLCPDCGEAAFLNVEGCKKCYICGYSEC